MLNTMEDRAFSYSSVANLLNANFHASGKINTRLLFTINRGNTIIYY